MDQDKAKKIFNEAQNFFIKKNYSLARENWLKILKIYFLKQFLKNNKNKFASYILNYISLVQT